MHKENDMQPILSISILISNHYENVKRCLESIRPLLDTIPSELILTDTGVEAELRQLMEQYTDHIIDFAWCQDFSAARNVGLKEAKGQWFLYIDDDEWFENTEAIATFLQSQEADEYNIACYIQRNYIDFGGEKYADHTVDRILRINPKLHFEHRVHEAYTDIDIKTKKALPVIAHHYGYCYKNEQEMMNKHIRNQKLLELECAEHPEDMRMRYQLVINPYTIQDWDTSIQLALEVVDMESNSAYWDACHTSILYCLEKKGDWNSLIHYGKQFLKKPIYPYDRFGMMQFMIDALWNTQRLEELCDFAEEALKLYQQYVDDPQSFNKNQLMQTTFFEKEYMLYFLMYTITAALCLKREALIETLSTGATADMVKEVLNSNELSQWIERNVSKLQKTEDDDMKKVIENEPKRERLVFDPSFFDQEERNGFVIEPMMKSAWAANLYVLNVIDRICEEHSIPYFADWGTLLGAVRHRGYIPWDDDIDICMLREDYLRFCEVVPQYKDEVELLNIYNEADWGEHADKVVNIAAFTVKRKEIKDFYGFPFTAGVDIFMVDYVPREKKLEKEQLDVLKLISLVHHLREDMSELSPISKEYVTSVKTEKYLIEQIEKMTSVTFSEQNPSTQELLILGEEVAGLYGEEDADYLSELALLAHGKDYYIPKEVYADFIRMPFENTTIPVPVGYDMLLRKKYGDNYMTPVNQVAGHDYPFYKKAIAEVASGKNQEDEKVAQYAKRISVDYYHRFLHKKSEPEITYDASYFEAETTDGVEITEEIKRIRAAQLEIYLEVKRICEKYHLSLFAIGDTLKAAVSVHDYLPTSNEIHLAMRREEYMRFLVVLQEELGPWFDYRNVYAYENYEDMRCIISSDGYLCDEKEFLQRFHGCKETASIDISAIDNISKEETKEGIREMLIENLLMTAKSMPSKAPYSDEVLGVVEEWKHLAQVKIDTERNLRHEFVKAAESVAGAYRGECDKVRISSGMQTGQRMIYDADCFAKCVEVSFGQTQMWIPIGYDKLIKIDKEQK